MMKLLNLSLMVLLLFMTLGCKKEMTRDEVFSEYYDKKEYKLAYEGFAKLAEKGDPQSQIMVASMKKSGLGTEKNELEAVKILVKLAKEGHKDADDLLNEFGRDPKYKSPEHEELMKIFNEYNKKNEAEAEKVIKEMQSDLEGL
jgi:TPR repeat protein